MDGGSDIVEQESVPLFSLSTIKSSTALQKVAPENGTTVDDIDMDAASSDEDEQYNARGSDSDDDEDEEARYTRQMEEVLDQMYKQYVTKRDKRAVLGDMPREADEDNEIKSMLYCINAFTNDNRGSRDRIILIKERGERVAIG